MDNRYHDKLNEHINDMTNNMYTFEVTKCCGYSTFVTIYKNENLLDLYSNIIDHFGGIEIKALLFYTPTGERIRIHISKNKISDFVKDNITCNPPKLVPVYPLPNPVIYCLYVDDGHCNNGRCNNVFSNIIS